MGDVKTPDFDDLLAAFDIPDATGLDAKEPIQGNHEEAESELKEAGVCLDESLLSNPPVPTADIPAVSVIVKNTSCQEALEGFDDVIQSRPALQNGLLGQETSIDSAGKPNASFVSAVNGETPGDILGQVPVQQEPDGVPVFTQSISHFSPEAEGPQNASEERHPKKERPHSPEGLAPENLSRMDICMFDNYQEPDIKDHQRIKTETTGSQESSDISVSNETEKTPQVEDVVFSHSSNLDSFEANSNSGTPVDVPSSASHVKSQTSSLSSCFEATTFSLNTTKNASEPIIPREASVILRDCMKQGPKVPISPRSPRSPLEVVKRLIKAPDSPVSICSDGSGKASPAVASGSPPAIPKVRIKIIKTTSGQIKRTVTSVLPDSETDEVHSVYELSPSCSVISEDSPCNASPRPSQTVEMQSKAASASTSLPKVLCRKSECETQPTTVSHDTRDPVKNSAAHRVQKPKKVSASTCPATSTNFVPKAMHLASLNLVPHSVAASVAARSTSYQQSQHTLTPTVYSTVPLVHQVKTTNPYPHMSFPNTAAGTLNRLMNHANPVPTYVPNLNPLPEWDLNLPPRGYRCLECGDSFVLEKSLAFHYSRRSVHIEVGCTHCEKNMVFFNKCALLAHARVHKNKGIVMQCTQLNMKPVQEEKMFQPLSSDPGNMGSYHSPLLSPSKNEPVLPLYPDNVTHRLCCIECNKQLPDHKALAGHYQKQSDHVEKLICKVCSMLLPNKCSFRAHQRLHENKSPYCCPECGALCRSGIQKHVRENCLHYARKSWYKCLHCDMVFRTLQGQKSHIEEKHCEVLHRCSLCPLAFKTSESCELHINNKHSGSNISPVFILKCSCEEIFRKKQLLFEHFHQDANKRVTSVFKCPECNSVFPVKNLLMQHFKGVHVGNIEEGERNSETEETDSNDDSYSVQQQKTPLPTKHPHSPNKKCEKGSSRSAHVKPAGWTCGQCLQLFTERETYVSHLKTSHGKLVKKYPCRRCEQSFNTAPSLRRHIRSDHDRKRSYTCWHCTDNRIVFTSSTTLKNHLSLMHGIKNPDFSQMPETSIQELESATPTMVKRTQTTNLKGPSTKRQKIPFRCSKCGFITGDHTEFQQHIPQHKTDSNTPQCLHCGLCFTSVLSLNRHLFIVHKVKDPEGGEEDAEMDVRVKDNLPL
ncbi:zinc finger protein 592 [Pholidichthys leucotaenia]